LARGGFTPDSYYPPSEGGHRDKTALKCFLHALGNEISFQYRPLDASKTNKALINNFVQAM